MSGVSLCVDVALNNVLSNVIDVIDSPRSLSKESRRSCSAVCGPRLLARSVRQRGG